MTRKIKSAYTRTRVKTSPKSTKTKAVQSEKHASDINNIMARAHKTGQLPVLMNRKEAQPLPDGQTYQDALNKVVYAQQQFEQLPSNIRTIFENDPVKMLEALSQSDKNADVKVKLQEIGLLEIPPAPPAEQSEATGGEATAKPTNAPASSATESSETTETNA